MRVAILKQACVDIPIGSLIKFNNRENSIMLLNAMLSPPQRRPLSDFLDINKVFIFLGICQYKTEIYFLDKNNLFSLHWYCYLFDFWNIEILHEV